MERYPLCISMSVAPEYLSESQNQSRTPLQVHHLIFLYLSIELPVWIAHDGYVVWVSTMIYVLWSRDNSLAGPVHSTDRDWLTTHSGNTLLAFNLIRVPRLEPGTDWSDSTRLLRSESIYNNILSLPNASVGIFLHVCWHGTYKDSCSLDGP